MINITLYTTPDIPDFIIRALNDQNIPHEHMCFIMLFDNPPDEIIEEVESPTGDTQYFCKLDKEFDIFTFCGQNHWYKAMFGRDTKAILINTK